MVAATQRTIKPVPVLDKPYWQERLDTSAALSAG